MQTGTANMENSEETALKTRNRTAIRPSNPTTGHTHRGHQNWKRHVYPSVHCRLSIIARTWKQPRCPSADEWIRKLWYISGILFSYKKECIWVSSNEVDEPGAYYTEWSKSEREIQILCTNTYVWNIERWYGQFYMQGSKGDRCEEQTFGLSGRSQGWDDLRE